MGNPEEVEMLRSISLTEPNMKELPTSEIDRDLKRAFPTEPWFNNHLRQLRNILLWYSWTNPSCSYCQSYTFIVFPLYKILHSSSKHHAMIDTYYCLHKLILLIKPLLPKSSEDSKPLAFTLTIKSLLHLELSQLDRPLYLKLRSENVTEIMILKGLPCLFLNWFTLEEDVELIDYIVDRKSSVMFKRLMNFLLAFFISNREIFMYFSYDKILELVDTQMYSKFTSILLLAKSLE